MCGGSEPSNACPSDGSNINKTMSMQHLCNDNYRERLQYWDETLTMQALYSTMTDELAGHQTSPSGVKTGPEE
jgi:hypothetical protein